MMDMTDDTLFNCSLPDDLKINQLDFVKCFLENQH